MVTRPRTLQARASQVPQDQNDHVGDSRTTHTDNHTQIYIYIYTYVQYTDERCLPWLMAAQGLLDQLGGFERSSRSYGEDVFISERVPEDVNEHEIS